MKKILLSVVALSLFGSTQAQVAYTASGLTEFQNMAVVDADGDTQAWGVYDFMTANGGNPVGTTFDSQGELLGSFSWDPATQAALTPDNWVITPAINLASFTAAELTWGRASVDPDWAAENYSVYVVAAADQAAAAAALATATPVYNETIATGDEWLTRSVNLNSFAGQSSVFVAFRHHACTDMFILALDDIMVSQPASVLTQELSVSVYPNPANEVLNFDMMESASSVSIVTLDGKVVLSENVSGNTFSVSVAELTTGMYVYEIVAENGSVARNTFMKK